MATVSHTIYSHYNPKRRTELEIQPIQLQDESADPWETESSFPARQSLKAPRFVPATMSDEDAGSRQPAHIADGDEIGTNLAGWYRSLTGTRGTVDHQLESHAARSSNIAGPSNPSIDTRDIPKRRTEARNKNNWFILRAIESEPSSASSTPPPTQTLADILARDPPPTEGGYSPPVWLALGPSNKGFAMLQQRGWNEGEGLGSRVRRRARIDGDFIDVKEQPKLKKNWSETRQVHVKKEKREVKWEDDVQEIQNVDVIDLTLSEDEEGLHESGAVEDALDGASSHVPDPLHSSFDPPSPHSPKALLTPIATVLKSDRLGIGLKAKTFGPYRTSQKRVTHGAAALAAHVRAAEDMRKKKAAMGRGRRGFAKMAKKEQERRQKMLSYVNN
jgi:hypothetical protein